MCMCVSRYPFFLLEDLRLGVLGFCWGLAGVGDGDEDVLYSV